MRSDLEDIPKDGEWSNSSDRSCWSVRCAESKRHLCEPETVDVASSTPRNSDQLSPIPRHVSNTNI